MKLIRNHIGLSFLLGLIIVGIPEILKVYLIMPMPGSQLANNVELAYAINKFIWVSRILGAALLLPSVYYLMSSGKLWKQIAAGFLTLFLSGLIYVTNFVMLADKMFYQPETKLLLPVKENIIENERAVLGVSINGEAKAYPIQLIGYHHQVRDSVGGEPVMVTYCTVCRTGRVYKPEVNGKPEAFRLVGMDQFNAMFEDATTKSWWRQATGECCAGPLKGKRLEEISVRQMTLAAWKNIYPETLVLQPDSKFLTAYKHLEGYDNGTQHGSLTGSDTSSFHKKSWIVGVITPGGEKMYDWNELRQKRIIQDEVGGKPIVLVMEQDDQSFYVLSRKLKDRVLNIVYQQEKNTLTDSSTAYCWNLNGTPYSAASGLEGLVPVQAYQEFYHSFTTFHTIEKNYK
jgi:hypothetical protein